MLRLSDALTLPLKAVTETFAVLGIRGSGKTHTASVLVEEMVANRLMLVVLDPVGAWWGLRASADGQGEGLPIAILGGAHGDVPITPEMGAQVAEIAVSERMPMVIDMSAWRKGDQERFVMEFAETLFHLQSARREPMHLFIDEADAFVPQQPYPGQQRMVGAIDAIVRRARIFGLGVTLITQRPAAIAKNVLEMSEVLIAHRIVGTRDRKAVDDWVKSNISDAQRAELLGSLASLETGEAWVSSAAWLKVFQRVQMRQRWTYDSSKTPEVGETYSEPTVTASVDVERLRELLESDPVEASGAAPAPNTKLVKRIAELERQLAEREVERIEVPVITDDVLERLEALAGELAGLAADLLEAIGKGVVSTSQQTAAAQSSRAASPKPPRPESPAGAHEGLKRGEYQMLLAIASLHPNPATRSQIGLLAGFTSKGSTFSRYLSTLRACGFLNELGGAIGLTGTALEYIGDDMPSAPATTDELVELWGSMMKAGERQMLGVLIAAYPASLTRKGLGEASGFPAQGSTFSRYLSTLRRNNLIDEREGRIFASADLFIGTPV